MVKDKKEVKVSIAKEFKPGEILLITDQVNDLAKRMVNDMRGHRAGIEALSTMLEHSQRHLWELLGAFYPVIKDYNCSYDEKNKIITFLYRRPEDKKNG
jgi:hypothetical protein